MNMQKQIFLSIASILLVMPASASAATISFRAAPATVGVGDEVRVDVLLDSAVAVNAFTGTLSYPSSILEPSAVSDGNSLINLWLTHPTVNAGSPISFVGITPGGFSGNGGILFTVLFRAKSAGTANISIENNIEILRNDGAGGNEAVTLKPITIFVQSKSSGGYKEPADITPPEPFNAYLSTNLGTSSEQNTVVFMTVDKGSGIDHYLAAESRWPSFILGIFPLSWEEAASPFTLNDQNLTSTVYIKAVDRAGNDRISVFPRTHLFTAYEEVIILVILIAGVLLFTVRRKRGR